MDFFNKIGKTVSAGVSGTASKAKELSEVQKLNSQISQQKNLIETKYAVMGKIYYEKFGEKGNISELNDIAAEINKLLVEIAANEDKINEIKGLKKCEKCGELIDNGNVFCPVCGAKQSVFVPKCVNCGDVLAPGARFCSKCGTRQPEIEAAPAPTATPAPVATPASAPIPEPVAEPVVAPIPEPIPEPVAEEPVVEPIPEPVAEEPAVEPIPEPVAEEPAVEPIPEPVAEEPVVEPIPEPVAEEPAVEPIPEPVAEEPAVEPIPEPIAEEPADEPTPEPISSQSEDIVPDFVPAAEFDAEDIAPVAETVADEQPAPTETPQTDGKACPNCGSFVPGDSLFCTECGADLKPKPQSVSYVFCTNCGNREEAGMKFCSECGAKMD